MYVLNYKYWLHYYERENIVHPSRKSSSAQLRLLNLRLYQEATLLTPGMKYTIASITVSHCDKCITMVVWIGTSLLLKMEFISCSNKAFRYSQIFPNVGRGTRARVKIPYLLSLETVLYKMTLHSDTYKIDITQKKHCVTCSNISLVIID